MERDYNIRLSDINKKLKYLRRHNDGSFEINRDIFVLETFIRRIKGSFADFDEQKTGDLYDDVVDDANGLKNAIDLVPILKGLKLDCDNNPFLNFKAKYSTLYLSDSDTVDLAYEFYKTQASIFFNNFLDIYDYLDGHLKFIDPRAGSSGEMVRVLSMRESYIYVPNNLNLTKATIFIHEMQHAIDGLENGRIDQNQLTREIASVFMEILACDYVAKELDLKRDGELRKAELHSIILSDSFYLLDKFDMFTSLGNQRIKDMDEFYRALKEVGYEDDEIDINLKYSTTSLVSYQLPYLLAIELYRLYKMDKWDTLEYLLGVIRSCNDKNIMPVLREVGFNLGAHYYDYQDELARKLELKKKN